MEAEDWKELREERKEKRWSNYDKAKEKIAQCGIPYAEFANGHFHVGGYDFWATTGLFIHRKTGKRGRGINALFCLLKHQRSAP